MPKCACGCGRVVAGKWSHGHNRRGVPPTNKTGPTLRNAGDPSGYDWVYKPDHHRAKKNGYVKLAWLVAEAKIGRPLKRSEDVHHINGVRHDDRPDNIEVIDHAEHARQHSPARKRIQGRYS